MKILLWYFFVAVLAGVESSVMKRQADLPDRIVRQPCTPAQGGSGLCQPLALCHNSPQELEALAASACPLQEGGNGVCCPASPAEQPGESPVVPPGSSVGFSAAFVPGDTVPVAANDIGEASSVAMRDIQATEELERKLLERGLVTKPDTPESLHQQIVFASPEAQALGKQGLIVSETSKDITDRLHLSSSQSAFSLPKVSIANSAIASTCPTEPPCPATKYRSADGSCNNLEHKDWGKSFRAFARLAPSQYADGVESPRKASDGSDLPSTRVVSTTVLSDRDIELPDVSMSFPAFGQFLDHDMTLTPATRGANNSGIVCCDPTVIAENLVHPACLTIKIPDDDRFYAQFQQTCMEFVRTLPAQPPTCTLGPREQMNQLTSYIDGSQVYGSNDDQANNLREKTKGRLMVSTGTAGREFPPHQDTANCKGDVNGLRFCFRAGDVRSAEQPQLATFQVLFLREHNRVAAELAELNPGWNDDILYQEARRIVGAKLQHITYNEFLPIILGGRVMRRFELRLQKDGFWNNYDPNTDATVLNEFATAAYRFGHSNVPSLVALFNGNQNTKNQRLRDHFLRPYEGESIDDYVGGLAAQASMVTDTEVTEELTNHLFERGGRGFGLDLPALNMQRGRDHAIATYTQMREICHLPPIGSFQDMEQHMYPGAPQKLSQLYKGIQDVDLWIGGVSEKPIAGGVVGPTFACVIAEQFRRTRKGDRLWYERGGTESSFTEAQLEQIRQSSMARIFCDNSDVQQMQPLVFLKPSSWNAPVPCSGDAIPKVSTRPWRNEPVWT